MGQERGNGPTGSGDRTKTRPAEFSGGYFLPPAWAPLIEAEVEAARERDRALTCALIERFKTPTVPYKGAAG